MSNEDQDMLALGRMESAARDAWNANYFKCTPQVSLEDWARIWKMAVAVRADHGGQEMNGNHWAIFNGAGGVVADNMPLEVVHAYMTPQRFERGWNAVYCLVVRAAEDLPPLADSRILLAFPSDSR